VNLEPKLLRLVAKAALPLLIAIGCGVLGSLAMIMQARLLSHAVNGAFLAGLDLVNLQPVIISLVLVVFIRGLLQFGAETASVGAAIKIKAYLRGKTIARLFELGPVGVSAERSGELATVVTQGVEALDAYFSQYLPQLVLAVLIPVSLLGVMFPVDVISALVLLVTAPLIPIFMLLIGKGAEIATLRQFTALQRLSANFLDTLQGVAILKTFNQSKAEAGSVVQNNYGSAAGHLSFLFSSGISWNY
jgi:ATP-binding cassette subfamily C protein CydD